MAAVLETLQAHEALRARDPERALALLHKAAEKTSVPEADYLGVLAQLRHVLVRSERWREALSIDWYGWNAEDYRQDVRSAGDPGRDELLGRVPALDAARTLQGQADARPDGRGAAELYAGAAALYEREGRLAAAAIARERQGDLPAARRLWAALAGSVDRAGADAYACGLARFNVARICRLAGDEPAAHHAVVEAVQLLEEAADRYERAGQRERAFDCFQVLVAIGRHTGQFEHVLEGYVNAVRILREDNLRYYALQSYEEAVARAREAGELAAGATLAKEWATYAAAQGMPSVASWGARTQAELWEQAAGAAMGRFSPPEIAENALLAAVTGLARLGQWAGVGRLYATLGSLPLEPARVAHYERAARRYEGLGDEPLEAAPLPGHLRQDAGYPEVWHVDLIEWEQQGSAGEACGDVVLDAESWPEVTRRRALLARLCALEIEPGAGAGRSATAAALPEDGAVRLAELLSQIELYAILSPLEELYRSRSRAVRLAVVRALGRFLYKRSFATLRRALGDPDDDVAAQACHAIEGLCFDHAFDPLARIFRESVSAAARAAALRALARVRTAEAAELMLGVLQHEGRAERAVAVEALKRGCSSAFIQAARQALPELGREAQASVREILQARGEAI